MWELFGKINAPEILSKAFLEVPSGIEPLLQVLQTCA